MNDRWRRNCCCTGLLSEHVQSVEWEKTQLQELDITGTDLTTECLTDLLTRLPGLRWLSAGQQDAFNDSVHLSLKSCFQRLNKSVLVCWLPGSACLLRAGQSSQLGSSGFGSLWEHQWRLPLQIPDEVRCSAQRFDPVGNTSRDWSAVGWYPAIAQARENPRDGNAWRLLSQDTPKGIKNRFT